MLDIGSWYLTMFDKPMFQFAQGIVIGVLIMGAIWLLHKGTHEDVQKGADDGQEQQRHC